MNTLSSQVAYVSASKRPAEEVIGMSGPWRNYQWRWAARGGACSGYAKLNPNKSTDRWLEKPILVVVWPKWYLVAVHETRRRTDCDAWWCVKAHENAFVDEVFTKSIDLHLVNLILRLVLRNPSGLRATLLLYWIEYDCITWASIYKVTKARLQKARCTKQDKLLVRKYKSA